MWMRLKKYSKKMISTAADIVSVKIKTIKRAVDFLSDPEMETIYDAQFSLPHAVSMVALNKKQGPEWMDEKNMFGNPEAKSVASKVMMEVDPTAEQVFFEEKGLAVPSRVEVKPSSGRHLCGGN